MKIETKILRVSPQEPEANIIGIAAEIILAGGLVAFPTETVYGLGANALDEHAVSRIFMAKNRPASDPIIAHIHHIAQLSDLANLLPSVVDDLTTRFWPGPLTLVLKRQKHIPSNLSAGLDTVAVRMPDHPVAKALLRRANVPIGAPSANLFTRPSPTSAGHVLEDLRGRIDLVLDGGPTNIGVESTVLDLTQDPPLVLRPGGVSVEALRQVIPNLNFSPHYLPLQAGNSGLRSPGMLEKHYSPRAAVRLYTGPRDRVLALMLQTAKQLETDGQIAGLIVAEDDLSVFRQIKGVIMSLGLSKNLAMIASNLFSTLRYLDLQGVDVILVRDFGREGLGLAIWDRLIRAAEGHVIDLSEENNVSGVQ